MLCWRLLEKRKKFNWAPYFAVNVSGMRLDCLLVSEAVDDVEGVADIAAYQFDAVEPTVSRSRTPMGYEAWKSFGSKILIFNYKILILFSYHLLEGTR